MANLKELQRSNSWYPYNVLYGNVDIDGLMAQVMDFKTNLQYGGRYEPLILEFTDLASDVDYPNMAPGWYDGPETWVREISQFLARILSATPTTQTIYDESTADTWEFLDQYVVKPPNYDQDGNWLGSSCLSCELPSGDAATDECAELRITSPMYCFFPTDPDEKPKSIFIIYEPPAWVEPMHPFQLGDNGTDDWTDDTTYLPYQGTGSAYYVRPEFQADPDTGVWPMYHYKEWIFQRDLVVHDIEIDAGLIETLSDLSTDRSNAILAGAPRGMLTRLRWARDFIAEVDSAGDSHLNLRTFMDTYRAEEQQPILLALNDFIRDQRFAHSRMPNAIMTEFTNASDAFFQAVLINIANTECSDSYSYGAGLVTDSDLDDNYSSCAYQQSIGNCVPNVDTDEYASIAFANVAEGLGVDSYCQRTCGLCPRTCETDSESGLELCESWQYLDEVPGLLGSTCAGNADCVNPPSTCAAETGCATPGAVCQASGSTWTTTAHNPACTEAAVGYYIAADSDSVTACAAQENCTDHLEWGPNYSSTGTACLMEVDESGAHNSLMLVCTQAAYGYEVGDDGFVVESSGRKTGTGSKDESDDMILIIVIGAAGCCILTILGVVLVAVLGKKKKGVLLEDAETA